MCCNATGYDLSYSMTKDGIHLNDNNLINRDGSFCYIIINVKPADSGHYQCIVSNNAGNVSSRIANVFIFGMCILLCMYTWHIIITKITCNYSCNIT